SRTIGINKLCFEYRIESSDIFESDGLVETISNRKNKIFIAFLYDHSFNITCVGRSVGFCICLKYNAITGYWCYNPGVKKQISVGGNGDYCIGENGRTT